MPYVPPMELVPVPMNAPSPAPPTQTSRLLGFLAVAGVLFYLVSFGFSLPGTTAWALLPVVLLGGAVLAAGVEAMAPRRWVARLKWGLTASAVVLAVALAIPAALAPPAPMPTTQRSGPSGLQGPAAFDAQFAQ